MQQHVMQICDTSNGVVDALNLQNEEPFTLETFENLINLHRQSSKTFILARVETLDGCPHQSEEETISCDCARKSFFYGAHQLNKIIFRKLGENYDYIFRLFALNPLTNTDIFGEVSYYLVSLDNMPPDQRAAVGPKTKAIDKQREKRGNSLLNDSDVFNSLMKSSIGLKKSEIKIAEVAGKQTTKVPRIGSVYFQKYSSAKETSEVVDIKGPVNKLKKSTSDSSLAALRKETSLEKNQAQSAAIPGYQADIRESNYSVNSDGWKVVIRPKSKTSRENISAKSPEKNLPNQKEIMTSSKKTSNISDWAYTKQQGDKRPNSKYKATFIGTDTDFLTQLSLRQIFRLNALSENDDVLFDIPLEVLMVEGIILPEIARDPAPENQEIIVPVVEPIIYSQTRAQKALSWIFSNRRLHLVTAFMFILAGVLCLSLLQSDVFRGMAHVTTAIGLVLIMIGILMTVVKGNVAIVPDRAVLV